MRVGQAEFDCRDVILREFSIDDIDLPEDGSITDTILVAGSQVFASDPS